MGAARASSDPAAWRPCGLITLTTDFGLADPYVGQMHGVILARAPAARIVDLTHGVPPQAIATGAFFLERSRRHFPPGTVHVAVVDPGVGSGRRLVVALDEGQAFLAPDNGLLPPCLSGAARTYELDEPRFALPHASRTFHGRDVLAPAAAALASGLAPESAARGGPIELVPGRIPRADLVRGSGEAEVLCADRYGNLVLSVRAADLGRDPLAWSVVAAGCTIPVRATYADVEPGAVLALLDSWDALEIAVRDGNAAERLGLGPGDRVSVLRQPA